MAMSRIPTLSERVKALDLLVSNYREATEKVAFATQVYRTLNVR